MAVQPYKVSPEWNETNLPGAIRNRHSTKSGVWGVLRVIAGAVELVFEDPPRRQRVSPGEPGLIPPQVWHHVELSGPARMQVEFYREKPDL